MVAVSWRVTLPLRRHYLVCIYIATLLTLLPLLRHARYMTLLLPTRRCALYTFLVG